MQALAVVVSNLARLGIIVVWTFQIADVICFTKDTQSGVNKRMELALSSVFYFILLCLCS